MTPAQIQSLVAEYVNASLESVEEYSLTVSRTDADREAASLAITEQLEASTGALLANDFRYVASPANDLLAKHGLTVERDSLDWKRLCRGLLVGLQTALQTELRNLEGAFSPHPATTTTTTTTSGDSLPPAVVTKRFSEVAALYFPENKRAPRTDAQIKSEFARFVSAISGDKPVGDITKADCRLYKEALLQRSLHPATITKHLHNLAHLFTWASGQGFVPEDYQPVKGLYINKRVTRQEKQERKPFTDAQLSLIVAHPDFLAQRTGKHPERYWMVLCLLLSGARREEIAQLRTDDIGAEGGVVFFNITNEGDSQSLKNQGSKRRVPVHTALVLLGFLKYVQAMRAEKSARLFPQLRKGNNGYGDAVGKWFRRLLRTRPQLTGPAFVLHSLRHTTITRLIAAGVPQDIREVLVGHASETVHGSTYVHRDSIPLKRLQGHLEKLDFRKVLKPLLSRTV